ncbi:LysM peptidoglycan-binding domain-containing protein, partial [Bordetella avium]
MPYFLVRLPGHPSPNADVLFLAFVSRFSPLRLLFATALLAVLAGCASSSVSPGFHRVESGETLSAIARRYNQSVPDLVRWNKLNSANRIEKGQLLRVQPPGGTSGTVASKPRSSAAS